MKRKFGALLFLVFLLIPKPVFAGQLDDAQAAYARKDYETAQKLFLTLAQNGDVKAQIYMGEIFYWGRGTKTDYDMAEYWQKKAALTGDTNAQHNLARTYQRRNSKDDDFENAFFWYALCNANEAMPTGHERFYPGCQDGKEVMAKYFTAEKAAEIDQRVKEWKPAATPALNP